MTISKNPFNKKNQQFILSFPNMAVIVLLVLFVLILPLLTSALAQNYDSDPDYSYQEDRTIQAKPPVNDPNDRADKLNDKFDKVHGNLEKFLDNAIDSDDIFDANQIKYFKNQKNRSKKNKDRFHKNGGFRQAGRKNNFDKNNRNKDEYDFGAFDEIEGAIDNLNQIVVDANDNLSKSKHAKKMINKIMANNENGSNDTDRCKDLVEFAIGYKIGYSVAKGLAILADTAYNSTSAFANQTAFGWNASSFAAVFAIAAGICEAVAEGLEIADDWQSSDIEAACLDQIDDTVTDIDDVTSGTAEDVNDLALAVAELNLVLARLNKKIDDVNDNVNQRFELLDLYLQNKFQEMETILGTPHGQRPGFSQK